MAIPRPSFAPFSSFGRFTCSGSRLFRRLPVEEPAQSYSESESTFLPRSALRWIRTTPKGYGSWGPPSYFFRASFFMGGLLPLLSPASVLHPPSGRRLHAGPPKYPHRMHTTIHRPQHPQAQSDSRIDSYCAPSSRYAPSGPDEAPDIADSPGVLSALLWPHLRHPLPLAFIPSRNQNDYGCISASSTSAATISPYALSYDSGNLTSFSATFPPIRP